MEVTLKNVSVEKEPLTYLGGIAGTCTGKEEEGDARKRALSCLKRGHLSVFEHISLTWDVRGVSRALTHQLVRHRLASYTQQSQRYVKFEEFDLDMFVCPPDVRASFTQQDAFATAMELAFDAYRDMVKAGVHPEDARYVLPSAMKTNIVVTMNLREFIHFYTLRNSPHAQWEIHDLAYWMNSKVLKELGEDDEWAEIASLIAAGGIDG